MWATYVPLWNTLAKQSVLWMTTKTLKKGCFRNLATAINYVWSLVTVVMTTFYGKLKFTHFCCCWYCYCYCRRCFYCCCCRCYCYCCRCCCCCLFCCPCLCRCHYHCHCHCYCYCYCSVSQQTLKKCDHWLLVQLTKMHDILHNYVFCFPFQENNFTI